MVDPCPEEKHAMRKRSDGAMTTIRVLVSGYTLLASQTLFVLGAVLALSLPGLTQCGYSLKVLQISGLDRIARSLISKLHHHGLSWS